MAIRIIVDLACARIIGYAAWGCYLWPEVLLYRLGGGHVSIVGLCKQVCCSVDRYIDILGWMGMGQAESERDIGDNNAA